MPLGYLAASNVGSAGGGGGGFSDFFYVTGLTVTGSDVQANIRVVGAAANRRIFFIFHGFAPKLGGGDFGTLESLTLTFGASGSSTGATRLITASNRNSGVTNGDWFHQSAWYLDEANTSGASIPITLSTSGYTLTSATTWTVFGWWSSLLDTSGAPTVRTYGFSSEITNVSYGYASASTALKVGALTTTLTSANTATAVNAVELQEPVISNPSLNYSEQYIFATAFSTAGASSIRSVWATATTKGSTLIENAFL